MINKTTFFLAVVAASLLSVGCPAGGGGGLMFFPPSDSTTVTAFKVGGTVTGLGTGDTVTLRLNDDPTTDELVDSNTGFQFERSVNEGAQFKVAVESASGTSCMASDNYGTVTGTSVTAVKVVCSDTTYALRVNVTGMEAGNSFVVQNNGGDDLTVSANGVSTFTTQVPAGAGYYVVVKTQQTGGDAQTCNATGINTGTMSAITTINIACGPSYYSISGNYSGLAGSGLKIRLNNTGEVLDFSVPGDSAADTFAFSQRVVAGTNYAVVVSQQPSNLNQTCTVTNGNGTISANVTNVAIACVTKEYTLSGSVTGLAGAEVITVQLNGGSDQLLSTSTTSFSWNVTDGTVYSVSVVANPTGKTCSVTNGSGTIAGANKTNVSISCAANQYTVGGSVNGLCSGQTITIRNNGGSNTIVSGATPTFTFPSQNYQSNYAVTVYSQPSNVSCTVTNGTGTLGAANVNNVVINCTGCASCNGDGSLTVAWTASRSYDVNDASGGGHKVYYRASSGVTEANSTVVDVPNTTSKTTTTIPGLNKGCTYYVKVKGYSAINPTGGALSSEVSRAIP